MIVVSYQNLDVDALRKAIDDFVFYSQPSNADGAKPCTNKDLNKVINNISALLHKFVDELES